MFSGKLQNYRRQLPNIQLFIIGGLLIVFSVLILSISGNFTYEEPLTGKPVVLFVLLLFTAGIIYLFLLRILPDVKSGIQNYRFIILIGLLLRILYLFSTPILEDDFYRYLWDGANLANGLNPYRIAPEKVINTSGEDPEIPGRMKELAVESGDVIHRINHPYVRTIYPVITQLFFALAYIIKPWSLFPWKLILLLVDIFFLYLLWKILDNLKISKKWVALYWWNPLLVKEIFNSGHLDILIFPFLFLSFFLATREKHTLASGTLGLAVNVKFWPVLIWLPLAKPLLHRPVKLLLTLLIFLLLLLMTIIPADPLDNHQTSAFFNYSTRWQMNDSIFKIILLFSQMFLKLLGVHPGHGQILTRGITGLIIFTTVIWIFFRKYPGQSAIYQKSLVIITIMFMVSPTQFPWYYCWLLPFLCIQPKFSLLLLTPLLSLYYLRYYFEGIGQPEIFDQWIVWVQFVPVWIFLGREWLHNKKIRTSLL